MNLHDEFLTKVIESTKNVNIYNKVLSEVDEEVLANPNSINKIV